MPILDKSMTVLECPSGNATPLLQDILDNQVTARSRLCSISRKTKCYIKRTNPVPTQASFMVNSLEQIFRGDDYIKLARNVGC